MSEKSNEQLALEEMRKQTLGEQDDSTSDSAWLKVVIGLGVAAAIVVALMQPCTVPRLLALFGGIGGSFTTSSPECTERAGQCACHWESEEACSPSISTRSGEFNIDRLNAVTDCGMGTF